MVHSRPKPKSQSSQARSPPSAPMMPKPALKAPGTLAAGNLAAATAARDGSGSGNKRCLSAVAEEMMAAYKKEAAGIAQGSGTVAAQLERVLAEAMDKIQASIAKTKSLKERNRTEFAQLQKLVTDKTMVAEDNANETLRYLSAALQTVIQQADTAQRRDADMVASVRSKTEAKIAAAIGHGSSSSGSSSSGKGDSGGRAVGAGAAAAGSKA